MEIRNACDTDVIGIVTLEQICLPADAWGNAAVASSVADTDCVTMVALEGERVVGYVTGRKMPPEAELYRICVHPEMRRRGVAAGLLDAFHTALKKQECNTCFLEVRASNTAAQTLYRGAGYTTCGVRRNYYRAPVEDAILKMAEF